MGYDGFVDFFFLEGGIITKPNFLGGGGGHLYTFQGFFKVNVIIGTFQIFWGMPEIANIWGGGGVNSRCWVQAYVSRRN